MERAPSESHHACITEDTLAELNKVMPLRQANRISMCMSQESGASQAETSWRR